MSVDVGPLFDTFVTASTFQSIQQSFHLLCTALDIDPSDGRNLHAKLRSVGDWKAQKLWKLLGKRVEQAEYKRGTPCAHLNTLVIGAGPCGLRAAIECALLGSRVHVVEQRDRFSRYNVLHLWEFVIHDLKALGAKIFYPKFCTGSIEHISIRQLQCVLLKVALVLGVQVHDSVSFVELIYPKEEKDGSVTGYRASLEPANHLLAGYEFDVLIGADGKRNTVPGFPREEMRGRLAIGITANFVNGRTPAEERVPEISGVAYIFNQSFFKEMLAQTGVDLENIVYYKDETHYFVMCAKKQSLIEQGVIRKDHDDVSSLLSAENVDREALCRYATAAADFATNKKLPKLDFALNHKSQPDIAMFDFTSLYSSKCSVRLVERKGRCLLMGIVGDSLHEPFWPTGSGCARGFLGVWDTAWLIREFGINKRGPLEMIAERESVYRLLAQATKDNLHKQLAKYTIDPRTRYVSLELTLRPEEMKGIVNSDNPRRVPITEPLRMTPSSVSAGSIRFRGDYELWRFCYHTLMPFKLRIVNLDASWHDGRALCALVSKLRPEAVDYFKTLHMEQEERLETVFSSLEQHLMIVRPCPAVDWPGLDREDRRRYIEQVVCALTSDMERVRRALVSSSRASIGGKRKVAARVVDTSRTRKAQPIEKLAADLLGCSTFGGGAGEGTPSQKKRAVTISTPSGSEEKGKENVEEQREKPPLLDGDSPSSSWDARRRDWSRGRELAASAARSFDSPSARMRQESHSPVKRPAVGAGDKRHDGVVIRPVAPVQPKRHVSMSVIEREPFDSLNPRRQQHCELCQQVVYLAERVSVCGVWVHRRCHRCAICLQGMRVGEGGQCNDWRADGRPVRFFCRTHLRLSLREKVARVERNERRGLKKELSVDGGSGTDSSKENLSSSSSTPSPPLPSTSQHASTSTAEEEKEKEEEEEQKTQSSTEEEEGEGSSCSDSREALNTTVCPPLPSTAPPEIVKGPSTPLAFFTSEHMRETALSRLRIPVLSLSGVSTGEGPSTPERAEFGVEREERSRKSSALKAPTDIDTSAGSTTSDDELEEEEERRRETAGSSDSCGSSSARLSSEGEEEGEADEDEEEEEEMMDALLEEDELAELERTVMELSEQTGGGGEITDREACSLIEKINRRRSSNFPQLCGGGGGAGVGGARASLTVTQMVNTPLRRAPLASMECTPVSTPLHEEEFFTPAVTMRRPCRPAGPAPTDPAPSIASPRQSAPPGSEVFATPSLDIREAKRLELERIRTEARERARKKSDAELGLAGVMSTPSRGARFTHQRHSVPTEALLTVAVEPEVTSDRPRAQTHNLLLDAMPSVSRLPPLPPASPAPSVPAPSSPQPGLLSKLFSPDLKKKAKSPGSPVNGDVVHCESQKETSILGKTWRKLKMRHSPKPSPERAAQAQGGERTGAEEWSRASPECLREPRPFSPLAATPSRRPSAHSPVVGAGERRESLDSVSSAPPRRGSLFDGVTSPVVMDRRESPAPAPSTTINDIPCAAVAPSPRVEVVSMPPPSSATPLSLTEKNIRLIQKKAEKIKRQHDDDRRRGAQDLQRNLQEVEIRLEQVRSRGRHVEERLTKDPSQRRLMEEWLSLCQERDFLQARHTDLTLKAREMELDEKYKELNRRWKDAGDALSDEDQASLLRDMLAAIDERKRVREEVESRVMLRPRLSQAVSILQTAVFEPCF